MTPTIKENKGEKMTEPTTPRKAIPEHETDLWKAMVRRQARNAAVANPHGRRAELPSTR